MKYFKIVFKKELKMIFRDTQGLIFSFLVPLIMFPLIFFFLFQGEEKVQKDTQIPRISIISEGNILKIDDKLYNYVVNDVLNDKVKVIKTIDERISLISGEIDVVIDIIKIEDKYKLKLIYDESSNNGPLALEKVALLINEYSLNEQNKKLKEFDTSFDELNPLISEINNYSEGYKNIKRTGVENNLLRMIIPLLITMFITIGGNSAANDLIILEKQKKTLEPLLVTRAKRKSIILAKSSIVILFCLTSMFIEFLAVVISILINKKSFGALNIYFEPMSLIMILFSLISVTIFMASLSMLISVSSKNTRSASSKSTILTFIPMIISYATMYISAYDVNLYEALFPIYNSILGTKLYLSGTFDFNFNLISIVINIIFIIIIFKIIIKLFNSENIIETD